MQYVYPPVAIILLNRSACDRVHHCTHSGSHGKTRITLESEIFTMYCDSLKVHLNNNTLHQSLHCVITSLATQKY